MENIIDDEGGSIKGFLFGEVFMAWMFLIKSIFI